MFLVLFMKEIAVKCTDSASGEFRRQSRSVRRYQIELTQSINVPDYSIGIFMHLFYYTCMTIHALALHDTPFYIVL